MNKERCSQCDLGDNACVCGLLPDDVSKVRSAYRLPIAIQVEFIREMVKWKVFVCEHPTDISKLMLCLWRNDLIVCRLVENSGASYEECFMWLVNKYVLGVLDD